MRKVSRNTNDMFLKWMKFRLFIALFFFMIAFMVIFARVFQLQVIMAPDLKVMAKRQHQKVVQLSPQRGVIYDRNMKEMAVDVEVDSLFVKPALVAEKRKVARRLSPILGMSVRSLLKKLDSESPFVWVKRQLPAGEVEKIKKLNLKHFGFRKERQRHYPEPSLAAHVIGFSGVDSRGLEGLELMYNDLLRGEVVYSERERDAYGREIILTGLDLEMRTEEKDIVLTIDKMIQYIAEKELKKTVKAFNAKSGMVIIMDSWTGEILAMVNEPSFNPNFFRRAKPEQWRNKAVTDSFEPGSTFKVFMTAAAIENGNIKPNDIFYGENGRYKVYTETIHDHKKYGYLSVPQIMKYSSNIGAVKIAEQIGEKDFYKYIRLFGFGSKTGIDLPGESQGLVRDVRNWSKVSLATISFGQGISVTGLQLVTALSAIANGGYLMKPYVVKKILNDDGSTMKEVVPVIKKRVLSADTIGIMKKMLKGVTKGDGTGINASLPGYEVGGKTGTAQKVDHVNGGYGDGYVSSFMGFLPIDNPRITMFVAIDEPEGLFYGGQVAAPLFREITRQVMPYLGILPDYKDSLPLDTKTARVSDKTERVKKSGTPVRENDVSFIPDFEGKSLRQVMNEARDLSLKVEIKGSGRAVSQWPHAGHTMPAERLVKVFFNPPS
jgi:cell division protein FtsI (penicillin-binding protein 3)